MSEAGEKGEPRFFFPMRHFRNQKPFSMMQFFICTTGAFLTIFVLGSLFGKSYYHDVFFNFTKSSFLDYKTRSIAKYSPVSIPYFWATWLAFFWSTIFFSFVTLWNFNPQKDIILNPRKDLALRKHLQLFFGCGFLSWAFLFTPIEAIEGNPADFAAITFYPLVLFFGTGTAVLAAFPIAFMGMIAKVIFLRRQTLA